MKKLLTSNPYIIYFILIIALSIFYMISCEKNPTESAAEIILPDSNLTFTQDIQRLFISKCASESGCHSPNIGSGPVRGLDLTSYGVIRTHMIDGSELLVIEFQGGQSFLYNILLQPLSGRRRMPPDRTPLSPNNVRGIKTWIDEGAPL